MTIENTSQTRSTKMLYKTFPKCEKFLELSDQMMWIDFTMCKIKCVFHVNTGKKVGGGKNLFYILFLL